MRAPWRLSSGENKKLPQLQQLKLYRPEDQHYEANTIHLAL
ncbi:hypothetical protein U471_02200 [Bacillus amyloliquefaciens CC178]|nr:hypothetical protein U471_02200 [Bacillus amyloliquefaciens CC178]